MSHHMSIAPHVLPRHVWEQIQAHLKMNSTGTPEDENQSIVSLLNTIGYGWQGTTLIRAPRQVRSWPTLTVPLSPLVHGPGGTSTLTDHEKTTLPPGNET